MKLPVHILDQDDNIPLPGGNYLLDLPTEAEEHLRFIDVKTGPTTIEKRILFLTPKQISGTDYNTEDLVHKVGSVGIFMEREPADTFVLFSFNINDRFRIASIETDEDGITWAEGHSMIEEFSPGEQELPELMISIYNNLNQHKEVLEPSVHKALNSTKFLLRKMDILANYLLSDRHDRISYLQQTENLDRWNLVIEHLRTYLKKGRPLKPKRVKDLVSKVPAPTKPVEIPMTLTERLQKLVLPDNVRPSVDKELERLERSNKSGSEYSMLQDYLSWVADLPWGQSGTKEFELDELKTQLDVSHHGLDDVKEYILEHFCMERITASTSGSVLCFSGSPGTGKTTIAKEIAKVSGRPLIRIALGGMSDEAELRGHRRTYLGSRPSRLIVGLKDAKSFSPLILLDEAEKVSRGHGDPMSALLEILDPEQNTYFVDRYLEFPIDLSKAMFICTV